jgi:acetolactate synthase-1/2/3 large subunit
LPLIELKKESDMSTITGWEMVVKTMKAEGVKYIFGLPGNPTHLYDALYDETGIEPVLVRHEAAGGFMAMAYALLTGEPAVCFASPGPGIANLVPAMLESLATCAPVVALAVGVDGHNKGKGAFQETDHIGIMTPVTKRAVSVPYTDKIPWAMRRAFSLATNGQPGPVFVEIPPEVGLGRAEMGNYIPAERYIRPAGDPARIEQAARLLAEAQRPIIVAGGGARRSRAHAELQEFSELLGMPVFTTPSGRGIIPEDHPLSCGQVGLYRTRLGADIFDAADLLITVGSRNEEFQTQAWQLFPSGARYIQIDISAFEIGRNWVPDVPIVGDAKLVLTDLLRQLRENANPAWAHRRQPIGQDNSDYRRQVAAECTRDDPVLKTKRVLYEMNQAFGKDMILVHENGAQDLWSYYCPYFQVLALDGVVAPGEQTCMGSGVAGAIGAKLARPDKMVVCVTGDGAFQMANQDLPTAVQYNAPVTWVILNNYSLGWPKYHQKQMGGRYIAVDYTSQPDFVQMAQAYGCYGEKVEHPQSIQDALERARQANQNGTPALLDCVIDPWDFSEGFHRYHGVEPAPMGGIPHSYHS